MRLIVTLIMAFLTVSTANAETFGEKREYFKDWLAACRPNTNYCSAITYINPNPGNGAVADHWLRVGRHQDGVKWEISITPIVSMPSDTTTFYFWIDEESFWFTKGGTALAYGAVNDIFLTGGDATPLLAAMLNGSTLKSSFDSRDGVRIDIDFSLSGLTAALLWVDDQQNRVGDPRTAGDLPAGLDLAEPKLTLPTAIPDDISVLHAKSANCDTRADLVHGSDWQAHQVNNNTLLFLIPCSAGAYNFSYAFYTKTLTYGDTARILFADYWDSVGWTGTDILFNAHFDPATRVLTSFYKGRGLGDCGTSGEWQWQEYGFKMLSFHAKSECGGFDENEDLEFPQIFPTN